MENQLKYLQQNIEQTKDILKIQTNLVNQLEKFQNNTNDKIKLKEIIDASKQNKKNIQQLLGSQYTSTFEIEETIKNFSLQFKEKKNHQIQHEHINEVEKLNQIIFQLKKNQEVIVQNLQNKWQSQFEKQNKLYQEKQNSFIELKKKIKFLSKSIIKNKTEVNENKLLSFKTQNQKCTNKIEIEQQITKIEDLDKIDRSVSVLKINLSNSENQIFDSCVQQFCSIIKEFKNIKTLIIYLSGNQISDSCIDQISQAIQDLNNIQKLEIDLNHNQISDSGVISLSLAIKELKNIYWLIIDLRFNKISDSGVHSLSQTIKQLNNLSWLTIKLCKNNISELGAKSLSLAINELKKLSTLIIYLGENKISDSGANSISQAIKELKNLTWLTIYLSGNQISDQGVNSLSLAFHNLKKLQTLIIDFRENQISYQGLNQISFAIKDLKYFTKLVLYLRWNAIGEEEQKQFYQNLRIYFQKKVENFEIEF